MAGFTTNRKPDGVTIYKEGKQIFLDKIEAAMLAATIKEARKKYWEKFRLPRMTTQNPLDYTKLEG